MLHLLSAVLGAVRLVLRPLSRPMVLRLLSADLEAVRLAFRLQRRPRRILPDRLRPLPGPYLSAGSGSGFRRL